MNNEGVEVGTVLDLEDFGDGLRIRRIRPQPVDGLRRKSDQPSPLKDADGFSNAVNGYLDILRILYFKTPAGTLISTVSFTLWPRRPRPTGEETEILFCA